MATVTRQLAAPQAASQPPNMNLNSVVDMSIIPMAAKNGEGDESSQPSSIINP
jgi:hypothetical protein